MSLINILFIGGGVIVILMLWIIIGYRHLNSLEKAVEDGWEAVDVHLRKRHNLVPNLIETFRSFEEGREVFVDDLIGVRRVAAKEYFPSGVKIEREHDLSKRINELMAVAGKGGELSRDTNFLELKKEIEGEEAAAEDGTVRFNESVRSYNGALGSAVLRLVADIFGFKKADIFEFEV